MILMENTIPVILCLNRWKIYLAILTRPNLPFPSSFPNSKSVILNALFYFIEASVDIVYLRGVLSVNYFLFKFPKLSFYFFFPNKNF